MEPAHDQNSAALTDQDLVRLYRSGQEEAFEALVKRYHQELFHFLLRFVGNRVAAEDIFQDTFLQLHVSIASFDLTRPFKPWLFTIGANKARDHLRRNSQRPMAQLAALMDDGEQGGPMIVDLVDSGVAVPHDQAEQSETRRRVQDTIAGLPGPAKQILLLAYFHQIAYKEIARMLDIPLGTVKSRLHAAVASFAQAWKKEHPGEVPPPTTGRAEEADESSEER